MNFGLNTSFRTKLVLVMSAVIAAISIFILAYYPTRLSEQETEALIAKAQVIANMSAFSVSPALVFEDRAAAEEAIRSAVLNPDVIYLAVVDDSGRVLTAYHQSEAERLRFRDTTKAIDPHLNILKTGAPVIHSGIQIGYLYLGISLTNLQYERRLSREIFGLHSISIFLIGIVIVFAITTLLTRPLLSVAKTAEIIAGGNLHQRADVHSHDEIGALAGSFNKMVDNLVIAQESLGRSNQELEVRVSERTRALQEELDRRRTMEDALYRSQQMLQLVLDTIPVRIFWKDRELRYLGCNMPFARDAGLNSPSEIIGLDDFQLSWKQTADLYRDDDTQVMETNAAKLDYEEPQHRPDGSLLWLRTSKVPLHDREGNVIGVLGTYSDITIQKADEERLYQQAAILEITRDAIEVLDLDDTVLMWNTGAERLYGWTAAEMIGTNPSALMYRHTDDPRRREAWDAALRTGEWSGELRQMTKDRGEVLVDSRWTRMNDPAGLPKSILIVNTDITERKQMEIRINRSQRLEVIGTLAGGIAHDLNNVLSPILMAIQLLQTKVADDRGRQWLSTIETAANRGADIVKQVLTFARGVEGERILLQPKHLVREVQKITSETFPRSIQIRTDIRKDLWSLSGDATQLHQVMMNLCVNARDAMPNGGALLITAMNMTLTDVATLKSADARPGQYVVISVADSGTGIPESIIDKIFDPFFTTKEVGKGTGLGLSTVQAIVKSHGGFITVESSSASGTRFSIYLPASDSATANAATDRQTEIPAGQGELLLIIDDESSVREITRGVLEAAGYAVITASNGAEGISMIQERGDELAVVLTDMMMPVMDGTAVIRAASKLRPSLKLIAASGLADVEKLGELKGFQVHAFLPKPFNSEKLLTTLHTLLHKS